MSNLVMVARGLNPNYRGKPIIVDGQRMLMQNVEHFDGRTVVTVSHEIELDHMEIVEVMA